MIKGCRRLWSALLIGWVVARHEGGRHPCESVYFSTVPEGGEDCPHSGFCVVSDVTAGPTPGIFVGDPHVHYSIYAIDVDNDGDVDVLDAQREWDTISWHENDGSSLFSEHVVASLIDVTSVFPVDLDADDDVDIIACNFYLDNDPPELNASPLRRSFPRPPARSR